MSATEESTAVALRWSEVWQQGTVDDLDAIFASNVVDHAPSGEGTPGLAAFKARCRLFKAAFPDLTCVYKHLIAQGEYVVLHWLASGTHQKEFLGYLATHRRVSWHGATILRVVQGKIVERWTYQDSDGLVKQLCVETPERPVRETSNGEREDVFGL
jgi:steroid delta-isomerase-like uncharacterized protein